MKKAVILTGSKQYIISEGETIAVELIENAETGKTLSFDALLVIDGDNIQVGAPLVEKAKVTAEVVSSDKQADKVTAIRYKAKKRVRKVRGHRQHQAILKITKIA
jgi:large subunit ribosomal protein L21